MANPSRGDSPSSYLPHFDGTSGIKNYMRNLKAQVISGTVISANVVYEVSHQLAKVPSYVQVAASLTKAQAASATALIVAHADQASAATATKFYVCGNKAGVKYKAFLLV